GGGCGAPPGGRRGGAPRRPAGAPAYKPLEPERLYLPPEELQARIAECPNGVLIPFAGPPQTVDLGGAAGRNFAGEGHRGPDAVFEAVGAFALEQRLAGRVVAISCQSPGSRARLVPLLRRHGLPGASTARTWRDVVAAAPAEVPVIVGPFRTGFGSADTVVITEDDVFGPRAHRPAAPRRQADEALRLATALTEGDFLVHVDHGIGRYEGLETVDADGAPHDCLRIVYRGGDRLFVPVEVIDLVSRYGDAESERVPTLDKLGGSGWALRRDRVKQRVAEMAHDLIRLAAERSERRVSGIRADDDSYAAFCAAFPHEETDDQLETIREIEADLASERPMDRLVCGDVGFGKTEVALRAARAVAGTGQQVAVVVPTTLLARQHYETFRSRFEGTGISVGQLSRLTPAARRNDVRRDLANGSLAVVVGTHALLAERIRFADLGLLVVDEEQHFGVAQKERLKTLRAQVHVLTLTATPIPRTLHMALTGVRDLSLISTPPVDRLAIRTYVTPFDPVVIGEAIRRERGRGGQVFCVVPRIRMLDAAVRELELLAPDATVATAHGRMGTAAIEEVMTAFYDQRIDILVSTSIIESGLDIAGANTLIVLHADRFGLSQLYQLRGRIGRRHTRGYAYFTLAAGQAMTENATKRLQVLQGLDGLGAGFTLASHDLDIRGAGNLLGADQSGHIREVGVELYQQLLREAVEGLRSGTSEGADTDGWAPQVRIRVPSRIPDDYVADRGVRLTLYRRLAALQSDDELAAFGDELEDRFGLLPEDVRNLLRVMATRLRCRAAGIERLTAGGGGLSVTFRPGRVADPEALLSWMHRTSGATMLDQASIRVRAEWIGTKQILDGTFGIADEIARLADGGEAGEDKVA
ncbi:MAG: transcription-repair coupling factor, partial [Rhodospirillales bacterium]|nr:transcription-repair coupling factor [Rhodospirillales bacterium]